MSCHRRKPLPPVTVMVSAASSHLCYVLYIKRVSQSGVATTSTEFVRDSEQSGLLCWRRSPLVSEMAC
jgi:hypothetical protein